MYYFALKELAAYFLLLKNTLGQVGLVDADEVPDELTEARVADLVILKLALSNVLHFHDAVIDAILQAERSSSDRGERRSVSVLELLGGMTR